ncbi:glyoxalase [Actinomadura darangshiensis]|uniref:Glyoxalase n=1 Tax=Actinomadura darangshiensis TaxID=705336 RepID=A0A4R5BUB2_9ACTN|nr:glyoxalase [Actinomadura darangshiensis]TDD89113.1 glyoxalase [Actinomadura darangshiensis]
MNQGVQTIIFPVQDLDKAKALLAVLADGEPYMDQPYYVGFKIAGQDVGLDPAAREKGLIHPTPYWHVADIRAKYQALLDGGAVSVQEVRDVGGGKLVASVKDGEGNIIGLIQAEG